MLHPSTIPQQFALLERPIPSEVKSAFEESDHFFPTDLQKFQFYDKYSRFDYTQGRRETWVETVRRATSYLKELSGNKLEPHIYVGIEEYMLNMAALPSMRLLAMAGDAARRQNLSIYNCSYLPVDSVDAFVEALIISMSGCGVGFSVESKYVSRLRPVQMQNDLSPSHYFIEDSTEGWADALRWGVNVWMDGKDVVFHYDMIRPAGAPLKVKGGRASGAEPFRKTLEFIRSRILSRQGESLSTLDAHDIMCAVGNAAVSGGTRRTAMISIFDYDDKSMLTAKDGDFEMNNSQRWNANNSVVLPNNLDQETFDEIFMGMVATERGEPGIFSRDVAEALKPSRRKSAEWGPNPCGEINLRPMGLCNLSIAVARADDTYETLKSKVEVATIIGTIQSMATHFPGMRPIWTENATEERLLGVDINGQMDSPVARDPEVQRKLKEVAIETNRYYAERLGVNQAAAVTCVKPSGNSAQLLNCSSGIHPRWSKFYVRNVRVGAKTPMFDVLQSVGVPMHPENGQTVESANTWVAHFPVAAPAVAIVRDDLSAIAQCEYWLQVKKNWTEHNPSVTVSYRPDEVEGLREWVWRNLEYVNGISFLPFSDAKYAQMPYEEITENEYLQRKAVFPQIDFSNLYRYETEDLTTASSELACVSGLCEVELVPTV